MAELQESIVGFELGPFVPPAAAVTYGYLAESGSQGYVTGDITTGAKRSGTYGLNSNVTSAATAGPTGVVRLLASNTALPGTGTAWEMRVRFFYQINTLPSANNLVVGRATSGTNNFAFQLEMNTSGQIRAVPSLCGNTTTAYQGTFTTGVWYQVRLIIAGVGSSAGGTVNGTTRTAGYSLEILTEDGTSSLASFSESLTVGQNMPAVWPANFDLGQLSGSGGPSCTRRLFYDDFWLHMATDSDVADMEWPRGTKVEVYVPTANGATNNFTRGGVDTGANWSQVSEIPKAVGGSSQYISSATAGHIDLYQHANLSTSTDVVYHIQAVAFVLDTTTPQQLQIGATLYDVGTNAVNGLYALAHQIYSNGATLSKDDFNALEFGIKKKTGATTLFSEQEYLEVLTGPPNIISEDLDPADFAVTAAYDAIGGLVNPGGDNEITLALSALGFRIGGQGVEINVPTPWNVQQIQVGWRNEETA